MGTTLLAAALLIGGAALVVALVRRSGGRGGRQLAGAAFFGTWLLIGVALLSHMQRMQPRYLDAVVPAIAAVVGIGIAALAGAPGRVARLTLVASAAAVVVAGILLGHPPSWLAVPALAAAAGGGLAVAVPSDLGRWGAARGLRLARGPGRARRGRCHGGRATPSDARCRDT